MRGGALSILRSALLAFAGTVAVSGLAVADTVDLVDREVAVDCTLPSVAIPEGVLNDLKDEIAAKWHLGLASPDAWASEIVVRVCFASDGRPEDFTVITSDGPSQIAVDRVFYTARRAVMRAYADGGLPLPPEKYDTWRVLDLVFDANGMRAR